MLGRQVAARNSTHTHTETLVNNSFCVIVLFCSSEKQHLKIPRDIQDAKMLAKVLDRYKDMYYFEVMFGVVVAYVLYPFTTDKDLSMIKYPIQPLPLSLSSLPLNQCHVNN